MQVLPSLCEVIPEARLNLAVHHLRCNQLQEASRLVQDLQPSNPQEYTLKGKAVSAMPLSTITVSCKQTFWAPLKCVWCTDNVAEGRNVDMIYRYWLLLCAKYEHSLTPRWGV